MKLPLVTKDDFISSYKNKKLGQISLVKKMNILPLKSSTELAGIAGDLISDGHIGSHMVIYSSNSIHDLNDFGRRAKNLFSINYEIRDVITNMYNVKSLFIFDAPLVRILKLCGIPEGNKALQPYRIPEWILQNDEFMAEFLRRLYGNDGCVTNNKNRIRIKIMFHKSEKFLDNNYEFLESIRSFLSKKEIKSTNIFRSGYYMRKDGIKTIGLGFEVHGTKKNMSSILNFYNHIGFYNKVKKKKLEASIKAL